MKNIILLTVGVALFTSCAGQISHNVYSSRQVGEVSMTYPGFIRSVRPVCVEQEESGLGLAGGGVAGGVMGSAIGRGHFAPTAIGAVAGAVAGSLIERKGQHQPGFEYVVQLENGNLMTIVQGQDDLFQSGEPVYVVISRSGRSRIIPQ